MAVLRIVVSGDMGADVDISEIPEGCGEECVMCSLLEVLEPVVNQFAEEVAKLKRKDTTQEGGVA